MYLRTFVIFMFLLVSCRQTTLTGRPNLNSKTTAIETIIRTLGDFRCRNIRVTDYRMSFEYDYLIYQQGVGHYSDASTLVGTRLYKTPEGTRSVDIPFASITSIKANTTEGNPLALRNPAKVEIRWADEVLYIHYSDPSQAQPILDAIETLRPNTRPAPDESRWGLIKEQPTPEKTQESTLEQQLKELKKLHDNGLITPQEYEAKRKQLLGIDKK